MSAPPPRLLSMTPPTPLPFGVVTSKLEGFLNSREGTAFDGVEGKIVMIIDALDGDNNEGGDTNGSGSTTNNNSSLLDSILKGGSNNTTSNNPNKRKAEDNNNQDEVEDDVEDNLTSK